MKTIILKGSTLHSMEEVHRLFAEELDFPAYYGHNLDALYDCLTDLHQPVCVEVQEYDFLRESLGPRLDSLLLVLNDAARSGRLTVRLSRQEESAHAEIRGDAMKALEMIRTRRSTRKFLPAPVEEDLLNAVLEAGRYAPSGGNSQTTHFLVVKSRRVLDELADLVKAEFAKMEVTPGMYKSMAASVTASQAGKYVFHYNAPVFIITANQKDYGNNLADCACALENMMIAANALDLGSCWINQLKWLNESPVILDYLRALGLDDSERVYGALALGYADSADGLPNRKPLPRTGNPVTYIED